MCLRMPQSSSTSPDRKKISAASSQQQYQDNATPSTKQRKHVTSACHSCKTGKVKCDGNHPCARCSSKQIACSYRTDEDGRSRVPVKRKLEQLENDNCVLQGVFDVMRDADYSQAQHALSLIRAHEPLATIHKSLIEPGQNSSARQEEKTPSSVKSPSIDIVPNSALASPSHISSEAASRVLNLNRLIDEPIHQVNAAPWTKVTSDDGFVSHLISLWATWEHLFPDGIVLDLFLRDMRSGNLESRFCSPFLVNCILAAACPVSDYEEAKSVQGVPSPLMNMFIEEAKVHLAQDGFAPSMTSAQGLGILSWALSKINQDREGYNYAIQAILMSDELSRTRQRLRKANSSIEDEDEYLFGLDMTCWGIFSFVTASLVAWKRPRVCPPPRQPFPCDPEMLQKYMTSKWSPYPRVEEAHQLCLHEALQQHAMLSIIVADLSGLIDADQSDNRQSKAKAEALHDIYVRLIFWRGKLPHNLKETPPACPSVLFLMMWWHGFMLAVLKAKAQMRLDLDHSESNSLDGDLVNDGANPTSTQNAENEREMDELKHHALEIATFARVYRARFQYSRVSTAMCQPTYVALYVLLAQNIDHRYDSEVTELLTLLRAASRRLPVFFTLFRVIQVHVRERKIEVPSAAHHIFHEFEKRNGQVRTQKQTRNSIYACSHFVPHQVYDESDSDSALVTSMNIVEFLQEFDKLEID